VCNGDLALGTDHDRNLNWKSVFSTAPKGSRCSGSLWEGPSDLRVLNRELSLLFGKSEGQPSHSQDYIILFSPSMCYGYSEPGPHQAHTEEVGSPAHSFLVKAPPLGGLST